MASHTEVTSPVVALGAGDDAVANLDGGERGPRGEDGAPACAPLRLLGVALGPQLLNQR